MLHTEQYCNYYMIVYTLLLPKTHSISAKTFSWFPYRPGFTHKAWYSQEWPNFFWSYNNTYSFIST